MLTIKFYQINLKFEQLVNFIEKLIEKLIEVWSIHSTDNIAMSLQCIKLSTQS